MLILGELIELKQVLLNKSSLKEEAFYQFLVDKPLSYPAKSDLTEIERICYSAFCTDIPTNKNLTNLIEAQRRTRPIRGMHYTENLIELTAMALKNPKLERGTLKEYSENHSTRDFYILYVQFPNLESNIPIAQGNIDEIALHLCKESFPQEWKALLLAGLEEISDLMDFYVIEQWYKRAMDDNPIVHQTHDIICVRDALAQIVTKTERCVTLAIRIVSALFMVAISYWLVPLIIRKWDQAEPIMAVIQFLFYLIGISFIVFVGFIPDRIKLFNSLKEKVTDWVFRRKGLNRLEVKERLDRLANQDEI